MLLDVSQLPRNAVFRGADNAELDLCQHALEMRGVIEELMGQGSIKRSPNFGFAMAGPASVEVLQLQWDKPYESTQLVVGWGDEAARYIANAVRKLRPMLRVGRDTLWMRTEASTQFRDSVDSVQDDGTFQWGDFPWGGGTLVGCGDLVLPVAVSGFSETEDDFVAKFIAGYLGTAMQRCMRPDLFN